ncbi:MAG: AAA family ATPase [Nitrospirae bacterium]|nr:AAA family ATPase [Nitrospirota bacterium]
MSHLSALIIDRDSTSMEVIAGYLKGMDIDQVLRASDLKSGDVMLSHRRPTVALLVIVEMKLSDKGNILAFVESVKKKYPLTSVFITCDEKESDLILETMRAGADDYLPRPVNKLELARAIEKVTRQVLVSRSAPEPGAVEGKTISVLGSKDGYGKTTVAVNLAACMALRKDRPVMIIDLDLQGGDVSTFLNIQPNYTIADVARNVNRIDANYVRGAMYRHESGLYMLAEPKNVSEVEEITAPKIKAVLNLLKGMGGYIVVDGGYSFDERALTVMDMSDMIILVGVLTLPAIRTIQKSLSVFRDLGYGKDKVKLIINRNGANEDIKADYAEKALNYPISWLIPNEYQTVVTSINRGIPLVTLAPASNITKSIEDIVRGINKSFYPQLVEEGKEEKKSLFKNFFKKD